MFIFDEQAFYKMIYKILILSFIPYFLFAQAPGKGKQERCWALSHPMAAIKVKRIYAKANMIYKSNKDISLQLDSFNSGGKLDGFRHVFFMAAFAQKVKVMKLRKLGYAHEKYNYNQYKKLFNTQSNLPDSMSTVMDLKNNELGFLLGSQNKKISLQELKLKAINEIKSGKAFILRRNTFGKYTDCEGNVLELNRLPLTWGNKKCLVDSSQ